MAYLANARATMVATSCCKCGIEFYVPSAWDNDRRFAGDTFWCPNGHPLTYGNHEKKRLEQEAAIARRQRDEARAALLRAREETEYVRAQRDRKARRLAAAKGQATKLRKRIAAGCCPCCRRTFQNLARHISTQHPEYADTEPAESES